MNRELVWRRALLVGRLALAGIFLYSGYAKLSEPWLQFAVSLEGFKLLPESWLEPVARGMPWCEVALGAALLTGVLARWFALIGSAMLITFMGAAASAFFRGLQVDCGCFGAGGAPLGPVWFAQHGSMVLLALLVTIGAFLLHKPGQKNRESAQVDSSRVTPNTEIA